MSGRATTGLLIAAVLGVAVAGVSLGVHPAAPTTVAPTLAVDGDRVTLTLRAGGPVDVRRLDLVVRVDGDPLARQPPVPFFSAHGFHAGPRGPFNAGADPTWTPGERASFRVASTNRPPIVAGARVTVELRRGSRRLAVLSAVA